jgi:hypothetical protein
MSSGLLKLLFLSLLVGSAIWAMTKTKDWRSNPAGYRARLRKLLPVLIPGAVLAVVWIVLYETGTLTDVWKRLF